MPIFEFECGNCGNVFELIVLPGKAVNHPCICPKCESPNTERKYSTFGFKIKGYPGWVDKIDDYQKRQADRGETPTMPALKDVA